MDNTSTSNSEVHSCDVEDDSTDISIGSTCTNPKICEQNECTIPKAQDNTHSTNWRIALEKISLPQFWTYQQIGEELFTLFQTKVVNDTIKIVKGITLKQNSFTFCVNGESCTQKDFPNLVSTVLELEDCIKKFYEAQICTGIFIKDNFKLNCKLLASDTCYKEDKRSNIWKSYECDSLIFNSTVQDDPCKSTVHSCFFWRKLKGYVTKLLWKEKNQDCGVIAKCRKVIKNSKRILSRKVTKLQRLRNEITAIQKSAKVTSKKVCDEYLSKLDDKVLLLLSSRSPQF